MRRGQRGATLLCEGMLACKERGRFLRYQIKWEPCPARLSCAWRKAASKPSWDSTLMLLGHPHRTQHPHILLPGPFPAWLEGLKEPFSPRMPAFPLDPLPGQRRARPIGLRNPRWLLGGLQPPPKPGAQRLNAAFLFPALQEQLYQKDAENPCEAPRKRY